MSRHELLIGCVGKPSAGKSSFLNACTDANAKIGSYPFTTIEPNVGVTYFQSPCPCARFDKTDQCKPRYGRCVSGTRFIPVKMLDVAGLVPGASEGKGLGNKFLDDLRQADILLHIIDVSGTTNEKGEATKGYDPINDIEWLDGEIHAWIFNNLWTRWPNITRRHVATKSTAAATLQAQLSGYGSRLIQIQEVLDRMGAKEPAEMDKWDAQRVHEVVDMFMKVRFPTIYVLNKIDSPGADANVLRICDKYGDGHIILASALAECFLKKMRKANMILYEDGGSDYTNTMDLADLPKEEWPAGADALREPDPKAVKTLEKIRDLVLFRYGGTGVQDAIKKAVDVKGYLPVYPVRNLNKFTSDRSGGVFRDCLLAPPGTTVREFARMVDHQMEQFFAYAEGLSGQRLGEDELVTEENNILKFVVQQTQEAQAAQNAKDSDKKTQQKAPKKKEDKDKADKDA
jgi:ribosome-binding ATPase YchF (GTP1/OBG family)